MQQERSFLRRVCVLKPFINENCPSSPRAYFSIRLAVKTRDGVKKTISPASRASKRRLPRSHPPQNGLVSEPQVEPTSQTTICHEIQTHAGPRPCTAPTPQAAREICTATTLVSFASLSGHNKKIFIFKFIIRVKKEKERRLISISKNQSLLFELIKELILIRHIPK
jgi:hypothetical protein